MLKKNIVPNKKIVFNDEGTGVVQGAKEKKSDLALEYENEDVGGIGKINYFTNMYLLV